MYRVVCRLFDGSSLVECTENPRECVVRFFASYGEEVMDVEARFIGEEQHERNQLALFGS